MLLLAFSLATGCTKGGDTDDSEATTDDSEVIDDGVSPTVSDLEVYCEEHTTGDTFFQWFFSASYDDPQGLDDVPAYPEGSLGHLVEVYQDGSLVEDAELVVCSDSSGACVGSVNTDTIGVPCNSGYVFKLIISDYDGNTGSAEVEGET
jgi:hypothetical protein